MVSREGAIGLSPGLEWLAKWMFIPMEPTQERDFHIYMMQEELQMEAAAEKAVEEAVTKGLAAEKATKAAAVIAPSHTTDLGTTLFTSSASHYRSPDNELLPLLRLQASRREQILF